LSISRPSQLGGLTSTSLNLIAHDDFRRVHLGQISGLSSKQLGGLNGPHINALTSTQIAGLTGTQFAGLTTPPTGHPPSVQLSSPNVDPDCRLCASQLNALSTGAIASLSSPQLSGLSVGQLVGLPAADIPSCPDLQTLIAANSFTSTQIAKPHDGSMVGLSSAQIGTSVPVWFGFRPQQKLLQLFIGSGRGLH